MALRGTILVADDEGLARRSPRELLEEEGYQVHEAADGTTALHVLDEVDFDLILSDLKKSYKGVDNATMKMLMAMPGKGNVRELDNVLERAMILGNGEWVTSADLPRGIEPDKVLMASLSDNLKDAVQAYEKSHIEHVLKKMGGDKKGAAEDLGVSLSSLYRKLEEPAIETE